MTLITHAPAKVNLCLFLGPTRADGRHELVTLFQSLSLCDRRGMELAPDADRDEVDCPGVEGPNLAADALAGLRARGWTAPPVRIAIVKRVPVAAGMGGGSSDAAAALRLAAGFGGVPDAWIVELARELGADVPSALSPGIAIGTGAGEHVRPVSPLAAHALVIVPQPVGLSTAAVYREADRQGLARSEVALKAREAELRGVLAAGVQLSAELLVNDLEPASRALCEPIDAALSELRAVGAQNVLVCGSGPTTAGLWWGDQARERAERAAAELSHRYPAVLTAVPAGPEAGVVHRR